MYGSYARRVGARVGVVALLLVAATTSFTGGAGASGAWPIGTAIAGEISGYGPPGPGALAGYTQTYVNDFNGTSLPNEWKAYSGQPGGDPGALFSPSEISVGGGLLSINSSLAPGSSSSWLTGGICLCGIAGQVYGAFFERSRATGVGATDVALLWPDTNIWPPEIDFNETNGSVTGSSATVHWGTNNSQQQSHIQIDMIKWHTWGVIWSSTSIIYTVDGKVWGEVTKSSEIPTVAMHMSLQSQTWCASGWACPRGATSMLVDWVAEYSATTGSTSGNTPGVTGPTTTTSTPDSQAVPMVIRARGTHLVMVSWSEAGFTKGLVRVEIFKSGACQGVVGSNSESFFGRGHGVIGAVVRRGSIGRSVEVITRRAMGVYERSSCGRVSA